MGHDGNRAGRPDTLELHAVPREDAGGRSYDERRRRALVRRENLEFSHRTARQITAHPHDFQSVSRADTILTASIEIHDVPLRDQRHRLVRLKVDDHPLKAVCGEHLAHRRLMNGFLELHDWIAGTHRSVRSDYFHRDEIGIDLHSLNHGRPDDQLSHVATVHRMKDFPYPPVNREEIARCDVGRTHELQVKGIVAPQQHAIPDRLIVPRDHIDDASLGDRFHDPTRRIGHRSLSESDLF